MVDRYAGYPFYSTQSSSSSRSARLITSLPKLVRIFWALRSAASEQVSSELLNILSRITAGNEVGSPMKILNEVCQAEWKLRHTVRFYVSSEGVTYKNKVLYILPKADTSSQNWGDMHDSLIIISQVRGSLLHLIQVWGDAARVVHSDSEIAVLIVLFQADWVE